jgi:hypothetical protein
MTAQFLQHLDFPSITAILAAVTSIAAVMISLYAVIKRNADIYIMNSLDREPKAQQIIALKFDDLPQSVHDRYPKYPDSSDVCGLCTVVFANAGDRSGYVRLTDVTVDPETVAASRHNYATVPPNSIVGHWILLHNIPVVALEQPFNLALNLTYQCGGTRQDRRREVGKTFTATVAVSVSRSYH